MSKSLPQTNGIPIMRNDNFLLSLGIFSRTVTAIIKGALQMKRFCSLLLVASLLVSVSASRAFGQSAAPANPGNSMSAQAAPAPFDYKAKFLSDMKDLQTKFVGLAQAFPQDKYTWRPGEGVRSVSEVFLHVALGNYFLTSQLGAKLPEGITPNPAYEKSTTDKAAIVDALNKSFAFMTSSIQGMSADDLAKGHQVFGRPSTGSDVLFIIVLDLHEHLGQQIAYARVNGVVPPWTAERQANQAARGRGAAAPGGAQSPAGAPPAQKP